MNQKTAKLINKAARRYGRNPRTLKRTWLRLPQFKRSIIRSQMQESLSHA